MNTCWWNSTHQIVDIGMDEFLIGSKNLAPELELAA